MILSAAWDDSTQVTLAVPFNLVLIFDHIFVKFLSSYSDFFYHYNWHYPKFH